MIGNLVKQNTVDLQSTEPKKHGRPKGSKNKT